MRELYNKVLNNLEKVNFEKLWSGFSRYEFALYSSKEVYFEDEVIPWDKRFIGNTAIKYKDRYIAIWNIEHSTLQFDIRRISYYSGTVFLIVAYDLGINFEHSLLEQDKTVFEIVTDSFEYIKIDDLQLETALIEKSINENIVYKKDLIDKFKGSSDRIVTKGEFFISGYDPMNMIKFDNKIMCKTFIILTNQNTKENIMLMGETLLDMQPSETNKVLCFYR